MSEIPKSIAKQPVLKPAEDFYLLRKEGVGFIEQMGSELWTDYNTHDPGITILEACCYAITDLAYRIAWDIKDILSNQQEEDKETPYPDQAFFTAKNILTVNPVTADDFRRLLIDLEDVRNAWVTEAEGEKFSGLYNVLIELEDGIKKDEEDEVLGNIKNSLNNHRNLCEDFNEIELVQSEKIAVCAEIDLRFSADVELIQERILLEIENYFNPPIPFRSLDELFAENGRVEEIFNGPQVTRGFLTASGLESALLRTEIRTSDIINILMDIDGIICIRNIALFKYDEADRKKSNIITDKWKLTINCQSKPILALPELASEEGKQENNLSSCFVFYKNGLPLKATKKFDELVQLYKDKERSKSEFSENGQDIPIPAGVPRGLDEYFPIQYSFPVAYGVGPDGLSGQVSNERKAQAKQLKAYLMVFEKILANSFAHLKNTADLFSLNPSIKETHFEKKLDRNIIIGFDEISNEEEGNSGENTTEIECSAQFSTQQDCGLKEWSNNGKGVPPDSGQDISKRKNEENAIRRNRFLNHLLARFGESFDDYGILRQVDTNGDKTKFIDDKIALIKAYQNISSKRGKAFDYTKNNGQYLECEYIKNDKLYIVKDSNAPELKRRIGLLLGCPNLTFVYQDKDSFKLKNRERLSDSVYLKGIFCGDNIGGITERCHYIIKLMSEPEKYGINKDEFNIFSLDIYDSNITGHPISFKTREDAESLKDELLRWSIFQRAIVVEHILLRPKSDNEKKFPFPEEEDIYSSRLTFVIPGWHGLNNSDQTSRESFITMRDFTERIIRQETPAHLFVNILWVDRESFEEFEKVWYNWLKAKTQAECSDISICRSAVLDKLCMLKNIYPYAGLNNSVCLGKTTLGSSEKRPARLGEIVLDNSKLNKGELK